MKIHVIISHKVERDTQSNKKVQYMDGKLEYYGKHKKDKDTG